MEKIVGRTLYNTNRDTKIVSVQGAVLFITASANFYLYYSTGQVVPAQMYEVKDWIKSNGNSFTHDELQRIKRYITFSEEE